MDQLKTKYILIDKPAGWTSFDVVAKTRSIIKSETGKRVKVGHTGTLDPFATGLLIILIGSATKSAQEYSKLDKTYEVEMTLGQTSSTGDPEGELTKISTRAPEQNEIEQTLENFVGEVEQIPPKFSAIKVGGKRAYQLARAGKEVNIEPRKVLIRKIELTSYVYPKVLFTCHVSSGTYVRTLCEDIGKQLKTGAYCSALRRTKVGDFDIKDAQNLQNLDISAIMKFN